MKTFKHLQKLGMLCAALFLIILSSCNKETGVFNADNSISGGDIPMYALTDDNKLLSFSAKNPTGATATNITGLQGGETLLGIDFRPATGELYGIGSSSRLYVINKQTGAARAVVTSAGQNLRLHPETGGVAATDGAINGAANASITAAAYTNNRSGAATTVLYVLDAANDKLYKQDPPNNGTLVEIGNIGFDAEQIGGFDIAPTGEGLATIKKAGVTSLYIIDLTSAIATKIKNDFTGNIIGLAIPTEPVAYAISSNNELLIFNPLNPIPVTKTITGIAAGENILGIDFRPATGQLYALGSTSRLYVINTSSGAAAAIGSGIFTTPLLGSNFGFDFNPTVDRIRIVSNSGQNLRLHPETGAIAAIDIPLNPGTPSVTAAAYTNNFAGATTTTLFDIDTQTGRLVKQDPPNNGVLVDVGSLGVTASAANGFDIGSTSGTAYALLTVGGVTKVYTINLTTGVATAGATLTGSVKAFTLGLGF
jgi:hypothetical protein